MCIAYFSRDAHVIGYFTHMGGVLLKAMPPSWIKV